ncbi:hypothetical protein MASR1M60_19580 [Rhodocyclaceae bacterium]
MKKIALVSALSPLSAFAAVPENVTTAISTGGTDAATVAAAVFVAIIGIFAVKLMRKGL